MDHLQPYFPRKVLVLPTAETHGWKFKRYGILAKGKTYDPVTVSFSLEAAIERLPEAGSLRDPNGNHGVGIQLIHFAEVAVVSPVFYWVWGSVLASTDQMRAQWNTSDKFNTGVKEVVGCIWEMQILCFEIQSWKESMLSGEGIPEENLSNYLKCTLPSAEKV